MREVIEHWRRASGLVILVDWHSLADVELGPRSQIECSATNRSWRDALDGVLEPLGLAWAPTGVDTIWIASRKRIESVQKVEFYPLDPTRGMAMANALGASYPEASITYDTASRSIIVRAGGITQKAIYEAWQSQAKPSSL